MQHAPIMQDRGSSHSIAASSAASVRRALPLIPKAAGGAQTKKAQGVLFESPRAQARRQAAVHERFGGNLCTSCKHCARQADFKRQPKVSNRAIAKALGVRHTTINRELEQMFRPTLGRAKETGGVVEQMFQLARRPVDVTPAILSNRGQRGERPRPPTRQANSARSGI